MSDEQIPSNVSGKNFVKKLVGFSMASWINCVLHFFATPIITRLFLPAELGKINLFITYTNLLMSLAFFGIDQAFTRFYYEPCGKNNKKSLLTVCISISLGISVLLGVGILLFGNSLSVEILGYAGIVVPVSLVLSIVSQVVLQYMNLSARMQNNVLLYSVQAVTITVISNISFVIIAFWSPKAESAIIFKTALIVLAAIIFFAYKSRKVMSIKNIDVSKGALAELFKYSVPLFPVVLLAILNNSIPQLMLNKFVDYTAIGIFSNGVTIAAIISILQSGFGVYWSPFVYENYKTGQQKIIKVHHIISFSMVALALVIILFQDLIFLVLVGEKYWGSKLLLPFLLVSPICYTISETLGLGIRIAKKTYLNIPVYIVNVAVNIILCFILLPLVGVIGAAIAAAVASVCMLIIKSALGEHLYRCSDNYTKVTFAITFVFIASVANWLLYDSIIKYAVFVALLIILFILYREQVVIIINLLKSMKMKKRINKE